MAARSPDPYKTLGVSRDVSDEDLRAAYRRLVQLHHPDHNGGSAESARRFEEVQDAYAQIRSAPRSAAGAWGDGARPGAAGAGASGRGGARRRGAEAGGTAPPIDPDLEARVADLERQLREAQVARERAREAARQAAAAARPQRPSDEELGYVKTDDSFSKILSDARDELSERFSEAREHPVAKRVGDLIDELESKLTRQPPPRH
jgi:curved DNA-binding protein CbpA